MPGRQQNPLVAQGKTRLAKAWKTTLESAQLLKQHKGLPQGIVAAIGRCINSKTKSYRYVLPTQILAKLVDRSLDCRAIQEGSSLPGSFDARSLCHGVIVPFDRENHRVLGGSTEPYVNNPLRVPDLTRARRPAQRNKAGFDDLCDILDYAQQNPSTTSTLFKAVLLAVRERLQTVYIVYPVPNRASLKQTVAVVISFLAPRTGGVRLQAVAVGLFHCVGNILGLYEHVDSAGVNAADARTGKIADLDCSDAEGNVVLGVEVKDRRLTIRHIQDKLPAVRAQAIRELLFVVHGGVHAREQENVEKLIDHEFVTGQNIYVCEFENFMEVCLVLFGEPGRRSFLKQVGDSLDEIKADLSHRQSWRDQLASM